MSQLQTMFTFIIFLGPLIFFHELGHFIFARLCGVRVETFSIGFGKKLFKLKKGATEYAISIIPLGGYVKMFGDDPMGKDEIPEEERQFAFTHKNKWQRFWIVFGGPLANFIMAFTIYYFLLVVGETVPQVKFGVVDQKSPFAKIGIKTGDIVESVNGRDVKSLEDLNIPESTINSITVTRLNKKEQYRLEMSNKEFLESFFGLNQFLRKALFINAKNKKTYGLSLDGNYDEHRSIEAMLDSGPISKIYITELNGAEKGDTKSFDVTGKNVLDVLRENNIYPMDLTIFEVIGKSPADQAGFKKDDLIYAINGKGINSFTDLKNIIQEEAKKTDKGVMISYMRDGKSLTANLVPKVTEHNGEKFYAIGVRSSAQTAKSKMVTSTRKGFFESIGIAVNKTVQGSYAVLSGFKRLFTGQASLKSLGGPIAIAKQASYSLDISLSYFFKMMAIISINLAILNLLPIPVLDGGHILFIFLEIISGGPVPRRVMLVAQQVGLSLLLMLMIYAIANDITRMFSS